MRVQSARREEKETRFCGWTGRNLREARGLGGLVRGLLGLEAAAAGAAGGVDAIQRDHSDPFPPTEATVRLECGIRGVREQNTIRYTFYVLNYVYSLYSNH